MAYAEYTVSTVTDIPALIAAFASGKGWSVSGTTLTREGGGLGFTVSAAISGANDQNRDVIVRRASDSTLLAFIRSPKLNGTSTNPVVSVPSKLHLFAAATPQPYLCAVIEYGFNLYRHLYIGNLEKVGTFDGGEIISACNAWQSVPGFATTRSFRDQQYLFSANQSFVAAENSGGCYINDADNPLPWRPFRGPTGNFARNNITANQCVLGGFSDGPNDSLLARAKSDWAGSQILVPVNLWAVRDGSGDTVRFSPIGRIAGVRTVNMEDLEPGAQIEVGNVKWRVFPALRKSADGSIRWTGGNTWAQNETSYFVGYAYLEG
jgi:hypothetical protein